MKNKIALYTALGAVIISSVITIMGAVSIFNENVDYSFLNGSANKVILFIGDGMGENHIQVASTKLEREIFFTTFDKEGYVETNSNTLFSPTDSAAAATALATGQKVNNREVAYHNGKNIESISEQLIKENIGVGIITTDDLTGATPSGFSSHAKDRGDTEDIIKNQLQNDIDLYLGKGSDTYASYKQDFIDKGYMYMEKVDDLKKTDQKVFGAFDKINNYDAEENRPTLPMLMEYAIDYFETNYPEGYFIMVEGAYIDKRSHDNNINSMVRHLDEFDNTISLAYDKLGKNEDVCFVVTADHECGDLQPAKSKEDVKDDLYKSTGHTSKNVKYFIHSNNEAVNEIKKTIDNTHIYRICKSLLG